MLTTLSKTGRVLRLFDNEHPDWGVSEVADTLSIPKSSAHALLSSLVEIGLLRRTSNRRYTLGWRLFALSRILMETADFRHEARPVMERLVERYRETVQLGVLERNFVLYVDRIEGTHPVRVDITGLGAANYAHCTAVGKALLAGQPWPDVRKVFKTYGMPGMTPNTITDLAELKAELEAVRKQGYAFNNEESLVDLCGTSAPIRDYTGRVVTAISMAIPTSRFQRHRDEYRDALVQACQTVSRRLGYIPSVS